MVCNAAVLEIRRSEASQRFASILLVLLLTSCAPHRELGQFRVFVEEFESLSARFGRPVRAEDLRVEFVEHLSAGGVAECVTGALSTPTVRVLHVGWWRYSPTEQKQTMFHELGHCVLERPHDDRLLPSGLPASIMHSHNVAPRTFLASEEYYLCELFQTLDCEPPIVPPVASPPPPEPSVSQRRQERSLVHNRPKAIGEGGFFHHDFGGWSRSFASPSAK